MRRFTTWRRLAGAVQRFFNPVPVGPSGVDGPGVITPISYG